MSEIDRLEIEVEVQASKANRALDAMSKKLEKVAAVLSGIDTSGLLGLSKGIEELTGSMDKMKSVKTSDFTRLGKNLAKLGDTSTAGLSKASKEMNKFSSSLKRFKVSSPRIKVGAAKNAESIGTDDLLASFAEKFKDVGKIDLSGFGVSGLDVLKKQAASLERRFDTLLEREEKLFKLTDNKPSGRQFENLEYDINAVLNKLDAYREKIAELEAFKLQKKVDFPITRMESSENYDDIDNPRSVQIPVDSMKYNAEAIRSTFGEAADGIDEWNEALERFGTNAKTIINSLDDIPVNLDTESFEGQIRRIKSELADLRLQGFGAGSENYDDKFLELEKVTQKQREYKKYMSELAKLSEISDSAISGEGNAAGLTADRMEELARKKSRASVANKELGKAAEVTATGLTVEKNKAASLGNTLGRMRIWAKDTAKGFSGALGSIAKGFAEMGASARKSERSMRGGFSIGKMVGMSILYSTVFRLISTVNQGFVEGFKNLAQYSDSTNQSISMLMSSMTQLKNSFATAFAPILDVVAPILSRFIGMISQAVTYVGMFFAALAGKKSFTRAIPVVEDYAASIKDASKDADDATDSAKELKETLDLLSFDEINKLSDNTDSGNSGKKPTIPGYTGPTPDQMFEEVPIDSAALEWADKFKDALKKIWEIAEPTREAMKRLYNEGFAKFKDFTFTALEDFWNNYLQPIGKWMLGDESGLPRFFNITNDLLNEIDWGKLNKSLADFFTSLQKPTKFVWTGLMDFYEHFLKPVAVWTMSDGIPQLVDALTKFNNDIHWDELNVALVNFWDALAPFAQNVGQGLVNFFKKLLEVGAKFINREVPDGLNGLADAIRKIKPETAERIGEALGKMLVAIMAFKGIGKITGLILDFGKKLAPLGKILSTIISPFKKLFASGGIFSKLGEVFTFTAGGAGTLTESLQTVFPVLSGISGPVMIAIGAITAIGIGLADLWKTSETFRDNVKNMWDIICQAFADAKVKIWDEGLKPLWDSLKELFGSLYELYEESGLKDIFEQVVTAIGYIVTVVLASMITAIAEVVKFIANVVKVIADILKELVDKVIWLKDNIGKAWDWIVQKFKDVQKFIANVFATDWSEKFGYFGEVINGFLQTAKDILDGLKRALSGVVDFIAGVFTGDWDRAWQGIKNIFGGVWDTLTGTVRGPVNSVLALVENMANGVIDAFNSIKKAINSLSSRVPSWIPGVGGLNFGMTGHIKLPRLAKGGIIDHPLWAELGEAGKEVVMPLENNTGWISKLSKQIANNMPTLNTGETFTARESGVKKQMNYQQNIANKAGEVVDALASGIAKAVVQMNGNNELQQQSNGGDLHLTVEIGGSKLVTQIVKDYNRMKKSDPKFGFVG